MSKVWIGTRPLPASVNFNYYFIYIYLFFVSKKLRLDLLIIFFGNKDWFLVNNISTMSKKLYGKKLETIKSYVMRNFLIAFVQQFKNRFDYKGWDLENSLEIDHCSSPSSCLQHPPTPPCL